MPRLIGINGLRTSGKDTTYGIVKELRPELRVDRAAFADNLKLMGARALGLAEGGYDSDEDLIKLMDSFKEVGVLAYGTRVQTGRHWWTRRTKTYLTEITGRQYLQYLGANARVVFGDTFWVDQVLPNPHNVLGWVDAADAKALVEASYPLSDVLCVTDVRYPNEAQRVLQLGGEVWEVVRPGIETDGHSSEQPLDRSLVSRTINNDGTIEDLKLAVEDALAVT
jgi:hypothetical protein